MKALSAALLGSAVLTIGCQTAQASVVKVVFEGTINNIFRQDSSTFGTVEVGDAYRGEYVLNFKDNKPFSAYGFTASSVSNSTISNSYNDDPALFYSITINGKTVKTILNNHADDVSYTQNNQNGGSSMAFANIQYSRNNSLYNEIDSPSDLISGDAFKTYTYRAGKSDYTTGFYTNYFNAFRLSPTRFSTSLYDTSTVPLPASAPMFGAALIALGGMSYGFRRKKVSTAI